MLQLQQLREKIATAGNLQGVVDTMRGLAAVNIRRAEIAAGQAVKYARTVHLALHVALQPFRSGAGLPAALSESTDESGLLAAVVITTDQGLCGQFNDRIISYTQQLLSDHTDSVRRQSSVHRSPEEARRLVVVGMRGLERLSDGGERIMAHLNAPSSVEVIPTVVSDAFSAIERLLTSGQIQRFIVIYNRMRRGSSFEETHLQLAPLDPSRWLHLPEGEDAWKTIPAISVPTEQILPLLIREQVYIDLFQAFTQSFAAENAARLASMQSASDNIEERLAELQSEYRRVRQEVITAELMDLMGGVEAVQ